MKRIVIFTCLLGLFGCAKEVVLKPNNLIDEGTMEDLYVEIALFNSAKSNNFQTMQENHILPATYLYEKYEIDSLQFSQSNAYYLSKPEVAEKILQKAKIRLDTLIAHKRLEIEKINKVKQEAALEKVKEKFNSKNSN